MIHFIVNGAHRKKNAKLIAQIEERLKKDNVEYAFHYTERVGHAGEIAKDLSQEECTIVGVGGDGTLHEILNGIAVIENVKLGLIPAGTGNDFAQAIGLPEKVEDSLDLILKGEAKPIDHIRIGDKRCMNVAGMGIDVDVLERCYRGKMKGKIKYLLSLVQSIFRFRGYEIETEVNGKVEKYQALFACACNGRQIGGGMRICPVAEVDDGKLDFVVVRYMKGLALLKTFVSLMKGKLLEMQGCEHVLSERIRITPVKRSVCQLDGELYGDLDFVAEVVKGLRFYRP